MLREVTEITEINENTEEGWSRKPLWKFGAYDRKRKTQRRGCEIYAVGDFDRKIFFSSAYADFGITGLHSISFVDYARKKAVSCANLKRMTKDTTRFSSSESERNLIYYDSSMTMSMMDKGKLRRLLITTPYLDLPSEEKGFKADVSIHHKDEDESISSLLRINDEKGISYTTRFAPLEADGTIFIGDRIEKLSSNTIAAVTSIRNVGAARNSVLEATAFGYAENNTWALSLSPDNALLNSVIVDGKVHKIGKCSFSYPSDLSSSEWKIIDENGGLSITFIPFASIKAKEKLSISKNESEEVFGIFCGHISINDLNLDIEEGYGSIKKAAGRN